MRKKFLITGKKGFHMTFANGVTASVQFGAGNYCDNYDSMDFTQERPAMSNNAEVAAWKENGAWVTDKVCDKADGVVAGYLTPEEVLEFLNNCANYSNIN